MSDTYTRVYDFFRKAHQNNRLSHLYLISGPKGAGKRDLALDVAALLLETTRETIEKGHINLYIVEAVNGRIVKEQIDHLQDEFSKTSLVDGKRVFIIDGVEFVNPTSGNRLLKFLEEPTSQATHGILLTNNIEQVMSTIISRSQVINLPSETEIRLKNQLIEKGTDQMLAELLPYLSKNIDELLKMSEDPNIILVVDIFRAYVEALKNKDSLWLFSDQHLSGKWLEKDVILNLLQLMLTFHLDIFRVLNDAEVSIESLSKEYQTIKKRFTKERAIEKIEDIQSLLQLLNRGINLNLDIAINRLFIALER